ncbi:GTPase domain-containing protein [Streptomyces sp. NPDC055140]
MRSHADPRTSGSQARVVTLVQAHAWCGRSMLAVNLAAVTGEASPSGSCDRADKAVVCADVSASHEVTVWSQCLPDDEVPFGFVRTRSKLGILPSLVDSPDVTTVFVDVPDLEPSGPTPGDPYAFDQAALDEVLELTDLALVPVTTEPSSRTAAEDLIGQLLAPRGIPFLIVLNRWDPGKDPDELLVQATYDWCHDLKYPYAPQPVRHYKVHSRNGEKGRTVLEYDPSQPAFKAREDVFQLALSIEQFLR